MGSYSGSTADEREKGTGTEASRDRDHYDAVNSHELARGDHVGSRNNDTWLVDVGSSTHTPSVRESHGHDSNDEAKGHESSDSVASHAYTFQFYLLGTVSSDLN